VLRNGFALFLHTYVCAVKCKGHSAERFHYYMLELSLAFADSARLVKGASAKTHTGLSAMAPCMKIMIGLQILGSHAAQRSRKTVIELVLAE
jgi:hypothetical protein